MLSLAKVTDFELVESPLGRNMSAHGVSRGFEGGSSVFSPVRGDTLIHITVLYCVALSGLKKLLYSSYPWLTPWAGM